MTLALLATLVALAAPQDCDWLIPSGATGNQHVSSIAIEGRELVLGYPYQHNPMTQWQSGRVKLVDISEEGDLTPATWLETPNPGSTSTLFGHAVARDGDHLAVTCPGEVTSAPGRGAVFLYEKDASGAWVLDQTLVAPPSVAFVAFGGDISLEGDQLLVGSPGAVSIDGVVFSYRKTSSGWTLDQTIAPANPEPQFGRSLARDGDALLVTSWTNNGHHMSHSASFFDLVGGTWVEQVTIDPELTLGMFPWYGRTVALEGDLAVISAANVFSGPPFAKGVLFVLRRDAQGLWQPDAEIRSDQYFGPTEDTGIGLGLAIDRGLIVTSAWKNTLDTGIEVWGHACGEWHRSHRFGGPAGPQFSETTTSIALSNGRLVSAHYNTIASHSLTCSLGRTICDPNTSNATGLSGRLRATGSLDIASNGLVLEGSQLPPASAGLMLFGRNINVSPLGNCFAELCLGSPIARGSALPLVASAAGEVQYSFDAQSLPPIVGGGAVASGETWTFQHWHRNPDPARPVTLTNAVSVTFE